MPCLLLAFSIDLLYRSASSVSRSMRQLGAAQLNRQMCSVVHLTTAPSLEPKQQQSASLGTWKWTSRAVEFRCPIVLMTATKSLKSTPTTGLGNLRGGLLNLLVAEFLWFGICLILHSWTRFSPA